MKRPRREPTLTESAAPFAKLMEGSEVAFEAAGTIQHEMLKGRMDAYTPLAHIAGLIELDLAPVNRRTDALHNVITLCIGLLEVNGADRESLRKVHEEWAKVQEVT